MPGAEQTINYLRRMHHGKIFSGLDSGCAGHRAVDYLFHFLAPAFERIRAWIGSPGQPE
jgi:hypothetical protein